MALLIQFVLERMIVSLPDIVLGGLGGFLALRGPKTRLWGVGLLVIYGGSLIGTALAGEFWGSGPVFGALAAIGFGYLAGRRRKIAK